MILSMIAASLTASMALGLGNGVSPYSSNVNSIAYNDDDVYVPEQKPPVNDGDGYEPNNTCQFATCLTPDTFRVEPYHSRVNANLNIHKLSKDVDVYYVKLFTDSVVTFVVYTPGSLRYTIQGFDYTIAESGNTASVKREKINIYQQEVYSDGSSYSFSAPSGTYFITLEFPPESDYVDLIPYTLNAYVEPGSVGSSKVNFQELMFSRDLSAALWLCDFPGDFGSYLLKNYREVLFQTGDEVRLKDPDPIFEDYLNSSRKEPIHIASYFIWDEDLISAIRETAKQLEVEAGKLKRSMQIRNGGIQLTFDVIGGVVKVLVTLVNLASTAYPVLVPIAGAASLIAKGLGFVLKILLNQLIQPTDTVDKFIRTLKNIQIATEIGPDQTGYRVLEIPLFCRAKMVGSDRWLDLSPTADYLAENTNWLRDDYDLYRSLQTRFGFQAGRIYGYKSSLLDPNDVFSGRFDLIDHFPDVPHSYSYLSLNVPRSVSAVRGDYAAFAFKAPKDDNYCIVLPYPSVKESIELSQFSSVPVARSDSGLVQTVTDGFYNDDHYPSGAHFDVRLAEGETIYLKVKKGDYEAFGPYAIEVRDSSKGHHVFSYVWKDEKTHWRKCTCGYQKAEGHFVLSSDTRPIKTCVFCHGSASMGFVGGASLALDIPFGNGSYLRPEGIYVLSDCDLEPVLSGKLTVPSLSF